MFPASSELGFFEALNFSFSLFDAGFCDGHIGLPDMDEALQPLQTRFEPVVSFHRASR